MTLPGQNPMPFASPDDRADELLAITRRLHTLVAAEIEALNARKLDGANADWDEKERLAHAWRLEVAQIKANPNTLKGAAEHRMTALRTAAQELQDALEAHARSLSAMKQVTEGLVRSIASEIASVRSAPPAYGRSGTVNSGAKREASGLTVNAKA